MLNENAKMFIVQQVVHWLSTPTHGYLGSNYGIDLYAELQKPLSEFDADGIINKMYADIPILANLPRDLINIHYQHDGIDDVKIFASIGSGADSVSIDLNFFADKLENSIIDRKMAFMQPKTEDAPEVQVIADDEKCSGLSDEIKSVLKLVEDSRNEDGSYSNLYLRRIDIKSGSNIKPKPKIEGYAYQIDKYNGSQNWRSASEYKGKPLPSGYDYLAGTVFNPILSDKELKEALEKVLGQSQQEVESILKCIK